MSSYYSCESCARCVFCTFDIRYTPAKIVGVQKVDGFATGHPTTGNVCPYCSGPVRVWPTNEECELTE